MVAVRHGDGTVLADSPGTSQIVEALRAARPTGCPRSSRPATPSRPSWPALAAARRTDADLARIDDALAEMAARHRGRRPRRRGRRALPRAPSPPPATPPLLARLMGEIARPDPGDPHRVALPARAAPRLARRAPRIADAIRAGDPRPPPRRCTPTSGMVGRGARPLITGPFLLTRPLMRIHADESSASECRSAVEADSSGARFRSWRKSSSLCGRDADDAWCARLRAHVAATSSRSACRASRSTFAMPRCATP